MSYPDYRPRPHALCRHCGRNQAQARRRRLCQSCYTTPAVRALYPRRNPLHGLDASHPAGVPRPLPWPTSALPGSPEKLLVLIERARLRQTLWHPADATTDPRDAPPGLAAFMSLADHGEAA